LALPLFAWIFRLGLLRHALAATILPARSSGLGVIFFTLVFRRVPQELVDLSRGEGASEPRASLTLLLSWPGVLTFALIHFVLTWQVAADPLVMLGTTSNKTVPVGLASLYGSNIRTPTGC
jgi:multiple sugar transport system permease protein